MRLRRGKFLKAKPIKYFHRCKPTYIYYYGVLRIQCARWFRPFSSVYCRAGSETALSKQSKQVVIASSMTPMDVNDISSRPETNDYVPESCQEPNRKGGDTAKVRKGGDTAKVIIIPTETANYIMGHAL